MSQPFRPPASMTQASTFYRRYPDRSRPPSPGSINSSIDGNTARTGGCSRCPHCIRNNPHPIPSQLRASVSTILDTAQVPSPTGSPLANHSRYQNTNDIDLPVDTEAVLTVEDNFGYISQEGTMTNVVDSATPLHHPYPQLPNIHNRLLSMNESIAAYYTEPTVPLNNINQRSNTTVGSQEHTIPAAAITTTDTKHRRGINFDELRKIFVNRTTVTTPTSIPRPSSYLRCSISMTTKSAVPSMQYIPSNRFLFYTPSTGEINGTGLEDIGLGYTQMESGKRTIPTPTDIIPEYNTETESLNHDVDLHKANNTPKKEQDMPSDKQKAADRFASLLCEGPFWLDITAPTDTEMRTLSKIFRIHPLTAEDIMTEDTREKCELFRNYYFICFRSFDADPQSDTYLEPISVFTIVMREGIISFHHRPTSHARNVLRRIQQLTNYVVISPDWINYALIDDITDAFAPLIGNLQLEVDSIDELVLILKESEQSDMLRRIGYARKKVMTAMRLLGAKADVMRGLIKRCDDRVGGEIGLYLGDIQDHLITMLQNVAHYEKIIARAHSNYLAQISIELTQTSNLTNDVMTKLTVLGTILVPMNVITGLWGMNVYVPGKDVEDYGWFLGIIGGMTLIGVILYIYMRRNKVL